MRSLLINFPLGHMANDWAPSAIWLLAPAIAASMGLSPSELGLLLSIHHIGAAMGYLPAGILADRVSHQGRLLAATFWWVAIGYFIASYAPGFWSLGILLAIAGMGDAAWHPIATGLLVEQMPKRRGTVLGIHAMGGTLAEVGAPLAVGFLLSYFDWRTTLQFSVLPTVIMGIVFLFYARKIPVSTATAVSKFELGQIVRHWSKPMGLKLISLVAIYNMALMALLSMTPLFLQNDLGFSPAMAGIIFATPMLAGSLLQPVVGRYSDNFDRQLVFMMGCGLAVVFALIASLSSSNQIVIIALVTCMATLIALRSGLLASAVDYAGSRASTTLGFVFVMLDGVGALGALTAGYVGETGLTRVFILAAVFASISLAIAVAIYATNHRQRLA